MSKYLIDDGFDYVPFFLMESNSIKNAVGCNLQQRQPKPKTYSLVQVAYSKWVHNQNSPFSNRVRATKPKLHLDPTTRFASRRKTTQICLCWSPTQNAYSLCIFCWSHFSSPIYTVHYLFWVWVSLCMSCWRQSKMQAKSSKKLLLRDFSFCNP